MIVFDTRELNQRNMELESKLEEMRNQQSSLREEKENELQQKYMDHLWVLYLRPCTYGTFMECIIDIHKTPQIWSFLASLRQAKFNFSSSAVIPISILLHDNMP